MTRRGQLIQQLREALGELTRPADDDDSVVFTVADTEFEFEQEALAEGVL